MRVGNSANSGVVGAPLLSSASNGGFPEPALGSAVRVVGADHGACGARTRVRVPACLPPVAVRRVVCRGCARPFEADAVELEADSAAGGVFGSEVLGRIGLPSWLRKPPGRVWRWVSVPLAGAAVLAGLIAIQGSGEPAAPSEAGPPQAASTAAASGEGRKGEDSARLFRESSFSLAVPAGWRRTNAAGGATFVASSSDGEADASLWVERDPSLSFAEFEARSLEQLGSLAGSAHVVERIPAPTVDETVVRLAADAPPDSPEYEVTLRASGPYRYYLSTTVQPGAGDAATAAAALVHGSLVPHGAAGGGAKGS
jgi:hypothetical protein